jgi:hypothetical protein
MLPGGVRGDAFGRATDAGRCRPRDRFSPPERRFDEVSSGTASFLIVCCLLPSSLPPRRFRGENHLGFCHASCDAGVRDPAKVRIRSFVGSHVLAGASSFPLRRRRPTRRARARTARRPRPPHPIVILPSGLGNIKKFLDVNRNEVRACVRVSVRRNFAAFALSVPFEKKDDMMRTHSESIIPPPPPSRASHRS